MQQKLSKSTLISEKKIQISGSKSETNRVLLLKMLFSDISIENSSDSDDSEVMIRALTQGKGTIDIHHAGTAMRFLTAFFATQSGNEVILTGSQRMKERPIHILVEALRQLGADISYVENEGFPPLKIKGKELNVSELEIEANVSSQYISALMLIAPSLKNGLKIKLLGEVTSLPYIKMTMALLSQIGAEVSFEKNVISVKNLAKENLKNKEIIIESDWSSASYWYSFVALSEIGTCLKLSIYKENSLQGDSILSEIYTFFGVETTFFENEILLEKKQLPKGNHFSYNLNNAPDIAQTIAVTCVGLGIKCELFGLHTLKIKETDRLLALHTEFKKLGVTSCITDNSIAIEPATIINPRTEIDTYNDHRMALAFAPLMLKTDIIINNSEVVSKSYPNFWKDVFDVIV